jgi:hypothetical protein
MNSSEITKLWPIYRKIKKQKRKGSIYITDYNLTKKELQTIRNIYKNIDPKESINKYKLFSISYYFQLIDQFDIAIKDPNHESYVTYYEDGIQRRRKIKNKDEIFEIKMTYLDFREQNIYNIAHILLKDLYKSKRKRK